MRLLVTGASRGAGRAMAEQFAGQGHDVVAMVRKPEDLTRLTAAWAGILTTAGHA